MADAIVLFSLFIILQILVLGCIFYLWSSQHFSSDAYSPNSIPTVIYYQASESMGSDTEYAVINSTSGLSSSRGLPAIDSEPV